MKPPSSTPATKNRFHASLRQLYLKNGMFAGRHAAQMCRRLEEIPNDLLPSSSSVGTVSPMQVPAAMYEGQAGDEFQHMADRAV